MHFLEGICQLLLCLNDSSCCHQVKDESRAQSPTLSCPGSPFILYPQSTIRQRQAIGPGPGSNSEDQDPSRDPSRDPYLWVDLFLDTQAWYGFSLENHFDTAK